MLRIPPTSLEKITVPLLDKLLVLFSKIYVNPAKIKIQVPSYSYMQLSFKVLPNKKVSR